MSGITDQGQMRPGFRSPPHSREAEESVIGAVLLSEEAVNEVMDRLHPPDFYVPAHQAIFEAMRELFDTSQAIDAVTVSEALRRRGEGCPTTGGRGWRWRDTSKPMTTCADRWSFCSKLSCTIHMR